VLRRDRGTVLLLFPAAFLIMIVLGAIVVDVGLSHVRARELEAVASSAANDALAALDVAALRENGELRFDLVRAEQIVQESVASGALADAVVIDVGVGTNGAGDPQLEVTLQLQVELIMAPALPGGLGSTTITRTRTASILG
jgi:Flp pilus assembly protein TadG